MNYGSVCSGIEAATVAWHTLGLKPVWFAEIEQFPSAVLAHHYPQVQNVGDMTTIADKITNGELVAPDILVGGTPCQAFSVAGLRQSLDDERGQLTLAFVKLANAIDTIRLIQRKPPVIIIWENVPGVISTKDNAFGCFLGALSGARSALRPSGERWTNIGCVFGPSRQVAWRVLDAQYFGVAQRRRRVFVVASARDISPTEILFEQTSVSRIAQSSKSKAKNFTRETRKNIKAGIVSRQLECKADVSPTLCASDYKSPHIIFETRCDVGIRAFKDDDVSPTLTANMGTGGGNVPCVAIAGNIINRQNQHGGNGTGVDMSGVSYTLTANDIHAVQYGAIVRRLTPVECERLQGFTSDYTKIPYRGKPADLCPDSPRYKAIGNSMAVPVMKWIGERIINHINKK